MRPEGLSSLKAFPHLQTFSIHLFWKHWPGISFCQTIPLFSLLKQKRPSLSNGQRTVVGLATFTLKPKQEEQQCSLNGRRVDLTRSLKLTSVPSGRTLVTESYLSRQLTLSHGLANEAVCNQRQESRSKCRVQRPTPPFSSVRERKGRRPGGAAGALSDVPGEEPQRLEGLSETPC